MRPFQPLPAPGGSTPRPSHPGLGPMRAPRRYHARRAGGLSRSDGMVKRTEGGGIDLAASQNNPHPSRDRPRRRSGGDSLGRERHRRGHRPGHAEPRSVLTGVGCRGQRHLFPARRGTGPGAALRRRLSSVQGQRAALGPPPHALDAAAGLAAPGRSATATSAARPTCT